MKTDELTGAELDYWVARAEGAGIDTAKMKDGDMWCAIEMVPNAMKPFPACILGNKVGRGKHPYRSQWFYPSSLWIQGGPIVERERLNVVTLTNPDADGNAWLSTSHIVQRAVGFGPTPLVAAMRCYVASKFGDEVDPVGAHERKAP